MTRKHPKSPVMHCMSAHNPRKCHIAPRFCSQIITPAACAMRQDARLQCTCSLALRAYRHAHDGAFYEQADMHKSKHTHLCAQTYEHDSAQPTHIAIIIPQSIAFTHTTHCLSLGQHTSQRNVNRRTHHSHIATKWLFTGLCGINTLKHIMVSP